jgi:DNA-nicking Smr family endonuclease
LPRVRSLTPEEAALWARVASTIRPLSRETNAAEPPESLPVIEPKPAPVVRPKSISVPAAPARPRPGQTLDSSWDRRLSKGSVEPDRVLDLHGMSLDTAWRAIDRGLEQAISRGERIVLLITGHHRPGEPPVRRGAIRAAVHDWLAASRHADRIAAVRGAHRRHGGGGSLYLILRRAAPRH